MYLAFCAGTGRIVLRLDDYRGVLNSELLRSLGAINVAGKRSYPLHPAPNLNIPDAPRRDYYEPELSLRKLMSGVLQERVTPLATAGADRLKRLRALAERDGEGNFFYLDRVKQLETWRRRLKTVLPMLTVLLGPMRGAALGKEPRARSS